MKKLLFLILLVLVAFTQCKKDSDHNTPIVPPVDTTSFAIPATEDIVLYEVNLRALSQTGDIPGVISRLDEIAELGVNVIWLMPIYPIGEINTVNSPYCVRNYKEVNPEFGTLADLRSLVEKAHKKNISIILDWVANHTAWDNPWITNKDWYTQDGQGNIISPPGTNWLDVADLNYNSQEMRLAMIDAMEYWVTDAGIDGFRCDAADMVPVDFWIQAIDSVSRINDSLIWLAEGANSSLYSAGFQMTYSWDFYEKLKSIYTGSQPASSLILVNNQEYVNMPPGKHKVRFTTNHDKSAFEATPMVLFNGEQGALAASVATIFLGGVPLIYGSQEVGVEENIPFFSNQPINWSLHPEMLQAYKDIFQAYNKTGEFRNGKLTNYSNADVLSFTRGEDQKAGFVIVNLKNKPVTYNIPSKFQNSSWNDAFDGATVTLGNSLEMEAYQYFILKNY